MTKGSAYTRARLRAHRLVNSWDIAKAAENKVFIRYFSDTSGKCVQVVGIGFETAPTAAWYDHGCKAFAFTHIRDKAATILAAQAWIVLQGYIASYQGWERDPFSGWHPKGTIARAIRAREREGVPNAST